jgi:hypothetical protein
VPQLAAHNPLLPLDLLCMPNLILVLEPEFGSALKEASECSPVWIVETKSNRKVCERIWKEAPQSDHREIGAVTSFHAADVNDRLSVLKGILPQLETHHGDVEEDEIAFPTDFVMEVIGLPPTESVKAALREFGFSTFESTETGFIAIK